MPASLSWTAGSGDKGNDAGAGGGFGGGTHPSDEHHGGGGGGSWATGNTAYDATAPTAKINSPGKNSEKGVVQFVYITSPCNTVTTRTGNAVRCTYNETVELLDFTNLVTTLFGKDVSTNLPIILEAWGGEGGNGSFYAGNYAPIDGRAGNAGYARTSLALSELKSLSGDNIYLYPGAKGAVGGENDNIGGGGGASSIISGDSLNNIGSNNQSSDPRNNNIFVIAGGGGGGGGKQEGHIAGSGGHGAVAIATQTLEEDISCGGFPGSPARTPSDPIPDNNTQGLGGNGGLGLCDASRIGTGGAAGVNGGVMGSSGIGGFGGQKTQFTSAPASWINSGIGTWNAGNGGGSSTKGGNGGAGFGGGGGGGKPDTNTFKDGGGAGGGGSWARQASINDLEVPVQGRFNPPNGNGSIVITFDICSVDPDSVYCTEDLAFVRIDSQTTLLVTSNESQLRMIIHGGENFDVSQLDPERVSFGFASNQPILAFKTQLGDFNADGFDDISFHLPVNNELMMAKSASISTRAEPEFNMNSVHCIYGALLDNTPLIGCARPQKTYQPNGADMPVRRF